MPTKLKPRLNHPYPPFEFSLAASAITEELFGKQERILELIGFNREYGPSDELSDAELLERKEEGGALLDEVAGTLLKAAATAVGTSMQSPRQLEINLLAIEQNPDLLPTQRAVMDPATLVSVARSYSRSGAPAHHVTEGFGFDPSPEAIRIAACAAIAELKASQTKRGARRHRNDVFVLATELASTFRRFQNGRITRRVGTETTKGIAAGVEYGPFVDFLRLVLPALEAAVSRYAPQYRISYQSIVKEVVRLQKEAALGQTPQNTRTRRASIGS